jgi:uncharacterized membrane protein
MDKIKAWFETKFSKIRGSIAFWPSLIATAYVFTAILLRTIGQEILGPVFERFVPFVLISDREVALSLLTTITGGLISMMVFSFSMVMVLLSNATSNLSPRLLPSLIGSKNHQTVLGMYLGTIMFNIIVAMGFDLSDDISEFSSVAVAIAVILGIVCLAMFVLFIHNVSRSIQVGVVLDDEHSRVLTAIDGIIERSSQESKKRPPSHDHLPDFSCGETGYFQGVDADALVTFAKQQDAKIYVTSLRGLHLLKGDSILRFSCKGDESEFIESLQSFMYYDSAQLTHKYYAHGIERIVEVAIRALSPGINDPGTALTSIDYLKNIFVRTIQLDEWEVVCDQDDEPRVWLRLERWESIVKKEVLSIYNYGKDDYSVSHRLIYMLEVLKERVPKDQRDRHEVLDELLGKLGS